MVIFLFLRNLSATIIPSLALPMSLVGTFAVMYLLGYSLDNLSLMALTLSVGFVVDDAIVMLENIVRHMEMGEGVTGGGPRRLAGDRLHHRVDDPLAGRGVHPGAVHGRHRRPAAPRVRRHHRRRHPGVRRRLADPDADAVQPLPPAAGHGAPRAAVRRVGAVLRRACWRSTSGACGACCGTGWRRWSSRRPSWSRRCTCSRSSPRASCPARTPAGSSRQHRGGRGHLLRRAWCAHQQAAGGDRPGGPERGVVHVGRGRRRRAARATTPGGMFIRLKPRKQRKLSADEVIQALRPKLAQVPGIRAYLQNPPPIQIGGQHDQEPCTSTRCRAPTRTSCTGTRPLLAEKIRELPGFQDVTTDLQIKNPQVNVADRPRQGLDPGRHRRARSRTPCPTPTAPSRSRPSTPPTTSTR